MNRRAVAKTALQRLGTRATQHIAPAECRNKRSSGFSIAFDECVPIVNFGRNDHISCHDTAPLPKFVRQVFAHIGVGSQVWTR